MAKTKRLPQQVIKVKNYGEPSVNRLAVVLSQFAAMEENEIVATLGYLKSKYATQWPRDNY